jgi:hypothetical protein
MQYGSENTVPGSASFLWHNSGILIIHLSNLDKCRSKPCEHQSQSLSLCSISLIELIFDTGYAMQSCWQTQYLLVCERGEVIAFPAELCL